MSSENDSPIFTYQTRLDCVDDQFQILGAMGGLLSRVERSLFADFSSGKEVSLLKIRISEEIWHHSKTIQCDSCPIAR